MTQSGALASTLVNPKTYLFLEAPASTDTLQKWGLIICYIWEVTHIPHLSYRYPWAQEKDGKWHKEEPSITPGFPGSSSRAFSCVWRLYGHTKEPIEMRPGVQARSPHLWYSPSELPFVFSGMPQPPS